VLVGRVRRLACRVAAAYLDQHKGSSVEHGDPIPMQERA
jgi:hypothetical protein